MKTNILLPSGNIFTFFIVLILTALSIIFLVVFMVFVFSAVFVSFTAFSFFCSFVIFRLFAANIYFTASTAFLFKNKLGRCIQHQVLLIVQPFLYLFVAVF